MYKIIQSKLNYYKIHWYDCLNSTNIKATEMALKGSTEGTIVACDYQTEGRGQRQNKWESEKGKNLTFSIILRPEFLPAERQFLLLKSLSLAVCDFLKSVNLNARIKWPNDIYIDDKKVAGMLIEHSITGEYISFSIVGVGLNINQKSFSTNALNPVSIYQITRIENNVLDVLNNLVDYIDNRYSMLRNDEQATISNDYFINLYRAEGYHLYESNGKKFKARISGILDTGELELEDEDKNILHFAFKEIQFI